MQQLTAFLTAALLLTGCVSLTGTYPSQSERKQYVQRHPEMAMRVKQAIIQGVPTEGMTARQVKAAMGPPERINTTRYQGEIHEQWVYGRGLYVYLDNGTVTGMQY
jgi:hypothetical protein